MAALLKNNDMAGLVGMSPPAFAKAVRTGRFTVTSRDEYGHALFDPDVVVPQYEATAAMAELQNHARHLPEGMRGGRPRGGGGPEDPQQTELFNAGELKTNNSFAESRFSNDNDADKYLKVKLAKEAAQAKLLALKLEMQSGELIRKVDVEKKASEIAGFHIGAITSLAPRLAQECADMSNRGCDFQMFLTVIMERFNDLIIEVRETCKYGENKYE